MSVHPEVGTYIVFRSRRGRVFVYPEVREAGCLNIQGKERLQDI
jgi:poly-beta-hydroxyalkanoate depolymerase